MYLTCLIIFLRANFEHRYSKIKTARSQMLITHIERDKQMVPKNRWIL